MLEPDTDYERLKKELGSIPARPLCPHCLSPIEWLRQGEYAGCPCCEIVMAKAAVVFSI